MSFVFTTWYFIMLILVAGIVASLVIFFKMDKKDKIMIEQFVKDSQAQEQTKPQTNEVVEGESKTE